MDAIKLMCTKYIKCTTHGICPLRARIPGSVERRVENHNAMMCIECALKRCNGDKARERVVMDLVLAPFKAAAITKRTSPITAPLPSPSLETELFGPAS